MMNEEVWEWAQWAGEKTGIPAEIIYSQWVLEAGREGIENPASRNFNLGGLTVAGQPGVWRKYGSVAEFAHDYVYSFLLRGYPLALGTTDITAFAEGLKRGRYGSYFGNESVQSYAEKLKSVHASLFKDTVTDVSSGEEPLWKRIREGVTGRVSNVMELPQIILQRLIYFLTGVALLAVGAFIMVRYTDTQLTTPEQEEE